MCCFSPRRTSSRASGFPRRSSRGMRVIDLSGAWRLNEAANRAVYNFEDEGSEQALNMQAQAVYGMPELHRDKILGAHLVANPGCYATSVILPLKPLVAAGLVDLAARHRCRLQKRRERRGQSAHRQDALHVRGRQSLRLRRLLASPHRRVAGADRHRRALDHLYAAPAAHSARNSLHDLRALQRAADAGEPSRTCITSFLRAAPMVRLYDNALPQIQYSVRTNYADIGFQLASGRPARGDRQLPRQPVEGRILTGRAESERHAGLGERKDWMKVRRNR